jgi:hypothetical protein
VVRFGAAVPPRASGPGAHRPSRRSARARDEQVSHAGRLRPPRLYQVTSTTICSISDQLATWMLRQGQDHPVDGGHRCWLLHQAACAIDTPHAAGRPVLEIEIIEPGSYTLDYPTRKATMSLAPNYASGRETLIYAAFGVQIFLLALPVLRMLLRREQHTRSLVRAKRRQSLEQFEKLRNLARGPDSGIALRRLRMSLTWTASTCCSGVMDGAVHVRWCWESKNTHAAARRHRRKMARNRSTWESSSYGGPGRPSPRPNQADTTTTIMATTWLRSRVVAQAIKQRRLRCRRPTGAPVNHCEAGGSASTTPAD